MVKSGGNWVGRYMSLEMREDTRAADKFESTDGFKDWGWKESLGIVRKERVQAWVLRLHGA